MKLVVLGATGGIGVEIVRQAMERGHSITAFVRKPGQLSALAGRIQIIQGDMMDAAKLGRAVEGHDGVLSAFGPRLPLSKKDADLLERFGTALTNAMLRTAVRRAVIVSTAFLFKDSIIPPTYLFGRLFFPSVVADAAAMERIVMASPLDWTLVRPPQLTDKPQTERYRVREEHLPIFGFKIARADVAYFMVRCVENHASSHKVVGLCS
ncbi:NAD(P)-dependent oxidoreductase [Terriglobus sp. TAA 43]|uniref:NAD(P)-dependent oxidoreductase n=1 Tax=Terriglobus sp. TAA 43 TaxID=278961 RepID=UPI000646472D|nr:SDR family oxidoreductase [Terriglobus sp. TAA 43]